jgi:antitoxin VapB
MSLNIKNEHVHDLARRAAEVTGKTKTAAIKEALERLLESYGADPEQARIQRRMDFVTGIVAEYVGDPGVAAPAITAVEELYDAETGLPRR